jgi:hypothetical protein
MAKELLNKDGSPMREYTSPLLERLNAFELSEESKGLPYWKNNAEEDYMKTPISVLRYIGLLEKAFQFKEAKALAIFRAGQSSMEEGGKSFDQFYKQHLEQKDGEEDLFIVKYSKGCWDDFVKVTVFVTKSEVTAKEYVDKFNRILLRWKRYWSVLEGSDEWYEDNCTNFARWNLIKEMNEAYYEKIQTR